MPQPLNNPNTIIVVGILLYIALSIIGILWVMN